MREQRQAEEQLDAARQRRQPQRVLDLMPQVDALRLRADLLLAEAVIAMCEFADQRFVTAWVSSTQAHALDDTGGE